MFESRINRKGQTTVPAPVRNALGLRPGARVAWRVQGDSALVTRVEAADPFAAFSEWASPADREGYAGF